MPTTFSALAAQDAATAYARAAQLAKSPERVEREFIAGQYTAARRFLQLAKEHRSWRRVLAVVNPTALPFYGDQVPVLMQGAARHRRAIREARVRLAAMRSAQRKAA